MKKRILSLAIAAACMCTVNTAFASYTFTDIEGEQYSWCAPQIEAMNKAGYINGYEDGTYRPDNQVTKLECISLFSRVMGSKDANNDEILELAHAQYDNALKGSSLPWGEDELAYMMYKGALTSADLTTYINGDAKDKPMTRGEAAVIITKAMGGESKAKEESEISLHYKDARDIPTNILQYVKYVTDEGIMNGIDDAFCADGTVTRSQIAVMLSRVSQKCDYSFKKGRIVSINESEKTVKYIVGGSERTTSYDDDTQFHIRGEKAMIGNVPANVSAVIQYSGDKVIGFDAMSDQADAEVTVIFAGYNSSSTTITLRVKENEDSTNVKTYICDVDVPITYQGSPATIKALKSGDALVLSLSDGKVQSITAVEKSITVSSAVISDITFDGDKTYIAVSSASDEFDGKVYPVSDSVSVTKNDKASELTDVYVGDTVTLTLKYGEISKIVAKGLNKTIDGVITALYISETSEMTLNVGGTVQKYTIPSGCEINVNGEDGSVYDLRIGDNISLTVQSGAVIKIKSVASIINTSGKVSGVVTAVNASYKFVSVASSTGSEPVNVFTTTKTKIILQKGGNTSAELKNISVGDKVECYITPQNGAYVADLIVVSSN